MWDLIVLGQIPGTQIQVNFDTWLLLTTALAATILLYSAARMLYASQLLASLRIQYILQTAAYTQLLLTRRHMQA